MFRHSQELATTHANKARTPPPTSMGVVTHRLQNELHRASNLDDAPAEGCTTRAA